MAKVKLKMLLEINKKILQKQIIGIKNKDNIIFKNGDTFYINKQIFKKENETSLFIINLETNICTYYLKEYNSKINMDIKIIKKIILDNEFYLEYELNDTIIKFDLEVIE